MEKTIFLGSDHAGFQTKIALLDYLESKNFSCLDLGTRSTERSNYADYAILVAQRVSRGEGIGILIFGSGIGVSIVANKFKGVRAALCRNIDDARLSREHNDANILCLGERGTDREELNRIVDVWLSTAFEGGRHLERVNSYRHLGEMP